MLWGTGCPWPQRRSTECFQDVAEAPVAEHRVLSAWQAAPSALVCGCSRSGALAISTLCTGLAWRSAGGQQSGPPQQKGGSRVPCSTEDEEGASGTPSTHSECSASGQFPGQVPPCCYVTSTTPQGGRGAVIRSAVLHTCAQSANAPTQLLTAGGIPPNARGRSSRQPFGLPQHRREEAWLHTQRDLSCSC